jgi:hypothetical protein
MQLWQKAGTDVQPLPSVLHADEVHWTPAPQLWLPVQLTSHAHEFPHATLLHELGPEHIRSHGPAPHSTLSQDCCPEHVMLHDAADWQLTPLRHEFCELHRIVQW